MLNTETLCNSSQCLFKPEPMKQMVYREKGNRGSLQRVSVPYPREPSICVWTVKVKVRPSNWLLSSHNGLFEPTVVDKVCSSLVIDTFLSWSRQRQCGGWCLSWTSPLWRWGPRRGALEEPRWRAVTSCSPGGSSSWASRPTRTAEEPKCSQTPSG